MGLPIQTAPSYMTELPSDGREVKFRPFLVKEQKILVLARESENFAEQMNAIRELISNVTYGKCIVDDMYSVDVEWLFLRVREKSVGEEVKATYRCGEDGCDGTGKAVIDLSKITTMGEIPESKTIKINDDVGVIVGLPKFKDVSEIDAKIDPEDNVLKIVSKSIEKIFSGDQVFDRNDMDDADLDEFIGSLTFDQLGELGAFFDNAPRLATDVQFKCNTCGKEQTKHLTGLQNFF